MENNGQLTYAKPLVDDWEPESEPEKQPSQSPMLTRLLQTSQRLSEIASRRVVHTQPILTLGEDTVVKRNTIVLLQGKYGSHKSRLAEMFLSLFIAVAGMINSLNFRKPPLERFAAVFIDSERNTSEEFPEAIQRMRRNAGYDAFSPTENFYFTSLKDLERKDRLKAVESYLTHVRAQTDLHLCVFIDVATDAVKSFNDDVEAMEFYDFLGRLCERHNCTVFTVVHENPGGLEGKARGHVGTEGGNKAATVISIALVKDEHKRTDLIRIRFQKLRAKPLGDVYAEFCDKTHSLKMADPEKVAAMITDNEPIIPPDTLAAFLGEYLTDPMPATKLYELIGNQLGGSKNTVLKRIKSLVGEAVESDNLGPCTFEFEEKAGRKTYFLKPVPGAKTDG